MATTLLTLDVPEPLHRLLSERAARSRRSVEEETLDLLGSAVPDGAALQPDLAAAVEPFPLLDDESLWRAARSRLAVEAAEQLEGLNVKRQRGGLPAEDELARAALIRQYERAMLIRAEAAAELHRRGHDVSGLVTP